MVTIPFYWTSMLQSHMVFQPISNLIVAITEIALHELTATSRISN